MHMHMNMVLLSLDSTDKGKQCYLETNNLPLDKEEGRRRDKTNLEKKTYRRFGRTAYGRQF
jgi:hypothetical protein